MELINETVFQHAHVKASLKKGHRLPPGRKRAAYTKMFMGLVYLGAFVFFTPKYNFAVAVNDDFMKMSLLKRFVNALKHHPKSISLTLCNFFSV